MHPATAWPDRTRNPVGAAPLFLIYSGTVELDGAISHVACFGCVATSRRVWRRPGTWLPDGIGATLVFFEEVLYVAVGLLLAAAAVLVLAGTFSGIVHAVDQGKGAVEIAVIVLDRILLTLIVAELVYTLRFVLRTHEIVVEPFLYIGLIAVVRRILIVTAGFERTSLSGRALTNLLLELGLLGLLVPALAAAIFLVRRADRHHAVVV